MDIDADGDMDLYSLNFGANNRFYINNGAGMTMTDATATYGITEGTSSHSGASWIDFDKDGDFDLYTVTASGNNHLYLNNGVGVAMTDVTATYGIAEGTGSHIQGSWVDIDNDGDLDLYTSTAVASANNHLYLNNGVGVAMTDATATYGISDGTTSHRTAAWVDIDNDGDMDLYSVNAVNNNKLYINNGPNTLMTDATTTYGVADGTSNHQSSAWIDFDNDDDLDLYTVNASSGGNNRLYINNGVGVAMTDATATYGIADGTTTANHFSSSWIDIDNDGDLDLYSVNSSLNNKLYINNGLGVSMTDETDTYGIADGTSHID